MILPAMADYSVVDAEASHLPGAAARSLASRLKPRCGAWRAIACGVGSYSENVLIPVPG